VECYGVTIERVPGLGKVACYDTKGRRSLGFPAADGERWPYAVCLFGPGRWPCVARVSADGADVERDEETPGDHLGTRLPWASLPEAVRRAVTG
jgi:hypothetical protein